MILDSVTNLATAAHIPSQSGTPETPRSPFEANGTDTSETKSGHNGPKAAKVDELQPAADEPKANDPAGPDKTTAIDIDVLLQSSPLTTGEDRDAYWNLVAEVEHALAPKDFFDKLLVADIVRALWEERRYRRQQVALTEATRFKALVCLAVSVAPHLSLRASQIALDYFSSDKEHRENAEHFLRRFGISDLAINAQAAELHAQSMASFDRMTSNRQEWRSTLVREFERRKRKANKDKARSSSRPDGPRVVAAVA
jgi:hypothetical protein